MTYVLLRYSWKAKKYAIACFHCQQCLEKSLKAVLQEKSVKPPKLHNIKILKDMAENAVGATLDVSLEEANFLTAVYAESRYPADVSFLSQSEPKKEDAQKALEIAQRIFAQVERMLEGQG